MLYRLVLVPLSAHTHAETHLCSKNTIQVNSSRFICQEDLTRLLSCWLCISLCSLMLLVLLCAWGNLKHLTTILRPFFNHVAFTTRLSQVTAAKSKCATLHTYMKPPCVCSRLSQSAGAVYDLAEEVGQLIFQLVPCKTFLHGPNCWVLPELLLQMPGQSMILRPCGLYIPQ